MAKDLINLSPDLACELGRLLTIDIQNQGLNPDLILSLLLPLVVYFAERIMHGREKTRGFEVKRGNDAKRYICSYE